MDFWFTLSLRHHFKISLTALHTLFIDRKRSSTSFYTYKMQSILHSIVGPKKEIHDLDGRVAIVTGGAFGIG
jgi:hypothetical protein